MRSIILFGIVLFSTFGIFAQAPLSEQLADTAMNRIWVDERNQPGIPPKWTYEQGVVHSAMEQMWYQTGDAKYFRHIKKGMDNWIDETGSHKDYHLEEYNIDHITPGIGMLKLYRVTGDERYKKIVQELRSQLKTHPRTKEGGFWHKNIYPWQMWLDGLYMAQPFYTEYSVVFGEDNFDDIVNQFVWMEKNSLDPKTGLLYHGWDESKAQQWADKTNGRSPHFWGRAMGWYAMALVDTLENFPQDHPRRAELIGILNRVAASVSKVQDKKSGVWWDILDLGGKEKNYLESSASAMFVYSIARGVRKGYLPDHYMSVATRGWAGIKKEFIKKNEKGETDWHGTVSVSGLGGKPYRDGSYEYYMSEKIRLNDAKGIGPAIKAALEMENYERGWLGRGQTVLLDDYFNHETRTSKATGKDETWHYKWNEMPDAGFYGWGKIFESYGASTAELSAPPTPESLAKASVYIIVDPDNEKESKSPKFIEPWHVDVIKDWVSKGGTLMLMGNDGQNAELDKFNTLSSAFGITFNKDRLFEVLNNDYQMGGINIPAKNDVFKTTKRIYVKEVSSLSLASPAKAILRSGDKNIIATAVYGKGRVFVIGDPWIYNEYLDGRRLPADLDNFNAAQDLTKWLLSRTAK